MNCAPQETAGAEDVILADIVVECTGSEAGCKRLFAFLSPFETSVKKIHIGVFSVKCRAEKTISKRKV